MLLSSKCRRIVWTVLFLLVMVFICQKKVHAAGWSSGQRSIWELIARGSEGDLQDGQRVSLANGDDKLYTITDRSLLTAPEALTVFSVANKNPKNLVIRIYNAKGQALGLSFNEKEKNCATAALYHGVSYYIRFTVTGTLTEKAYTVEAETLKETRGKLQKTLAPGEILHFYHHLSGPVWKGLKLRPIGENNVSFDVHAFDRGYKLHFDQLGTEERVFYANGAFFFFTAENTGEEAAVVNLCLGAPDDHVFENEEEPKTEPEDPKTESEEPKTEPEDPKTEPEEEPKTEEGQTTVVPIRTAGHYAFTVYNCGDQEVDAKVTFDGQILCAGNNHEIEFLTKPAEAFSMGGYFTPGSYTISVSSPGAYVVTMPTDRLAGSCGKNVWWHLTKKNSSETRSGRFLVKEEEYILEIDGFGPTYDYGYDSTIGYAHLPWMDAVESYSEETTIGMEMMIRRIVGVRVGGGITRLGEWLLSGFDEIEIPISLPDSLKEIGSFTFYGTNIEDSVPEGQA